MVDYIDGFFYIKPSLHPRDEAYFNMVTIILMCSWIQFVRILLSIFVSMFINKIGLKFTFLVGSSCGLSTRVIVASKNELGSIPSYSIFWNSLESIGVISSVNI